MKAIEEIGHKKTIRFLFYSFIDLILPLLFLPQGKKLLLSLLGAHIENGTILMKVNFFNWHHLGPKGLIVGKECFIGDGTLIDLYDSISIEDQVTIAQKVTIITHQNVGYANHPLQQYFPKKAAGVLIKSGAFVGAGSIILPGVTIGKQSFIAAGSVVNSNIPDGKIYGGVPAKLIRDIK